MQIRHEAEEEDGITLDLITGEGIKSASKEPDNWISGTSLAKHLRPELSGGC